MRDPSLLAGTIQVPPRDPTPPYTRRYAGKTLAAQGDEPANVSVWYCVKRGSYAVIMDPEQSISAEQAPRTHTTNAARVPGSTATKVPSNPANSPPRPAGR